MHAQQEAVKASTSSEVRVTDGGSRRSSGPVAESAKEPSPITGRPLLKSQIVDTEEAQERYLGKLTSVAPRARGDEPEHVTTVRAPIGAERVRSPAVPKRPRVTPPASPMLRRPPAVSSAGDSSSSAPQPLRSPLHHRPTSERFASSALLKAATTEREQSRFGRCCWGWCELLLFTVPVLLFLSLCLGRVFQHETKGVCTSIAMNVMRAQVREPGCVFDRQNDNLLVHMMCPLFNVGATDPGSGLRTHGYRLRVESRMQQYRIRRYYYQSQTTPTPVGTGGAGAVPAQEYCYCFEKFWSIRFVELDTDLRWHPKLCAYQNVNTQGYCYPYFPGSNPPILDNETDSRVSLGSGEIFDYSVRLGEHGLTVPSSVLTAIPDDALRTDYFPLLYQPAGETEERALQYGLVTDGRLAGQGWYHLECPRQYPPVTVHYLYQPWTVPQPNERNPYDGTLRGGWNPCRDQSWSQSEVGDRIITMDAYGVDSLNVLGKQASGGEIQGYEFPFTSQTMCSWFRPVVLYTGVHTTVDVDEIFEVITDRALNMTSIRRVGSLAATLLCVVLLWLILRGTSVACLRSLRLAVRQLSWPGGIVCVLCYATVLWILPMYMWIFARPVLGLQLFGFAFLCHLLATGIIRSGAEAAAKEEQLQRRQPSPETSRPESARTGPIHRGSGEPSPAEQSGWFERWFTKIPGERDAAEGTSAEQTRRSISPDEVGGNRAPTVSRRFSSYTRLGAPHNVNLL